MLRSLRWGLTLGLPASAIPLGCTLDRNLVNGPDVDYVAVSTARTFSCALTTDGEIFCWSSSDPRPSLISESLTFTAVSTYGDHTCAVGASGDAYCWGTNIFGQLGTEDPLQQCFLFGTAVSCSLTPVVVAGEEVFAQVAVGDGHTCALTVDGRAFCWGANFSGQLGTTALVDCDGFDAGGLTCSPTPVPVDGDLRFTTITAGAAHTCGLTGTGVGYCWGEGGSGRLGNGTKTDTFDPQLVSGGVSFRTLSAGGTHTCGVAQDASIYCWGSNADLQLGTKETELTCGTQLFKCFTTPQRLASTEQFVSVTTSDAPALGGAGPAIGGHSCGVTIDGRVLCWGLNELGQLVDTSEFRSAIPIELPFDERFTTISAGLFNTCGVTSTSTIFCWAFGSPLSEWFENPQS